MKYEGRGPAIFFMVLALAVPACGGDDEGASCVAGQSVACTCTDGEMGAQVCQADQTFGMCVCSGGLADAGPADARVPDAAVPDAALPDAVACPAGETPSSFTLAFYEDHLDLDEGTIESTDSPSTPWDVSLAYNSNGTVHTRVFQNQSNSVEIAYLTDVPFDTVTTCAVDTATFTTALGDVPFDAGSTVLIRTDLGQVYKLGNASESAGSATFDAALLP